jgi:hypothetical protein
METKTTEASILDNYDSYRNFILEEAEIVLRERKRFVQTDSIASITKLFNLDQMIDFFYLEGEYEIVQDLTNLKRAIMIKHFLKGQISDI